MVDGVEPPEPAAVEEPVGPVADEVAQQQHFYELQPDGLVAQTAAGAGGEGPHVLAVEGHAGGEGEDDDGDDQRCAGDRAGDQGREEPIGDVGRRVAPPRGLTLRGAQTLERPEEQGQHHEPHHHRAQRSRHQPAPAGDTPRRPSRRRRPSS
jgi:hypothetical protein